MMHGQKNIKFTYVSWNNYSVTEASIRSTSYADRHSIWAHTVISFYC